MIHSSRVPPELPLQPRERGQELGPPVWTGDMPRLGWLFFTG